MKSDVPAESQPCRRSRVPEALSGPQETGRIALPTGLPEIMRVRCRQGGGGQGGGCPHLSGPGRADTIPGLGAGDEAPSCSRWAGGEPYTVSGKGRARGREAGRLGPSAVPAPRPRRRAVVPPQRGLLCTRRRDLVPAGLVCPPVHRGPWPAGAGPGVPSQSSCVTRILTE